MVPVPNTGHPLEAPGFSALFSGYQQQIQQVYTRKSRVPAGFVYFLSFTYAVLSEINMAQSHQFPKISLYELFPSFSFNW